MPVGTQLISASLMSLAHAHSLYIAVADLASSIVSLALVPLAPLLKTSLLAIQTLVLLSLLVAEPLATLVTPELERIQSTFNPKFTRFDKRIL